VFGSATPQAPADTLPKNSRPVGSRRVSLSPVPDLPEPMADKQVVHNRYKDLAEVERAFRTSRTGHLEVSGHPFRCGAMPMRAALRLPLDAEDRVRVVVPAGAVTMGPELDG